MNRLFSIRRRRPHVVDVVIPIATGVDGYRLKWATNFDAAAFTPFITSTNMGFLDSNVNRNVLSSQPSDGLVRIVFDPTTYTIPDDKTFWMQFVPVTGGVEGTPGAATMVLSDSLSFQSKLIVISGTAPNVVNPLAALQIDLPSMLDFRVVNIDTARDILLAVELGGSEFVIPKGGAYIATLGGLGSASSLYVRAPGGAAKFTLSGTIAYSR